MCATRIVLFTTVFVVALFICLLPLTELRLNKKSSAIDGDFRSPHRKLMSMNRSVDKPTRFWDDVNDCTDSDIQIVQGPGAPLSTGIPTFTVEIVNACASGCAISHIHLHCGWFSSAHLIDPLVFERLRYNDCLVNGGRALENGMSFSFQYANTYSYPLSVASMRCL